MSSLNLGDEILLWIADNPDYGVDAIAKSIGGTRQEVIACVHEMHQLEWLRQREDDTDHDWVYRLAERGARRVNALGLVMDSYTLSDSSSFYEGLDEGITIGRKEVIDALRPSINSLKDWAVSVQKASAMGDLRTRKDANRHMGEFINRIESVKLAWDTISDGEALAGGEVEGE